MKARLLVAMVGLVLGALTATAAAYVLNETNESAAAPVKVPAKAIGVVGGQYRDWPVWGFTHTDRSADVGPSSGVAAQAIGRQRLLQNQHIMGWGVYNPEPSPGQYDFSALDRRVAYMRQTNAIPLITLCCAPDWMKGGKVGDTDESKLEWAPTPAHYKDFARLAATIARRYPDVRYFAVWNEMKGFYDASRGRWKQEAYTAFYNEVYDALKAVNPDINVGGPYVPVYSHARGQGSALRGPWGSIDQTAIDTIEYWLANKRGADFLTIDAPTGSDDLGVRPNEIAALDKFTTINAWLRTKTDLPIWWHEYYVEPDGDPWTTKRRTAVHAATLMEMARTGVSTVLYWNQMPKDGDRRCVGCLWTTTSVADGGKPAPMLDLLQAFARWFPAGTTMIDVRASSGKVKVLAQQRKMVAVNTSGEKIETYVGDSKVTLGPYEIRWLDR